MGSTDNLAGSRGRGDRTMIGGSHYEEMGVEPWDVVDTWPIEQQIGAHRLAALKYIMRMGRKDQQLQEVEKAIDCLEKLAEVLRRPV